MEARKRRLGDRRDGKLLRDLDSMHFITGIIYPNRCDNEAYISEKIDLTAINAYLAHKNTTQTDFPYTMFHVVLTALVKTITLRPKLNRFIVNGNFYQRNEISAAFVIKKQFSDKSGEGLAFLHTTGEDTLQSIHDYIRAQVTECRSGGSGTNQRAARDVNRHWGSPHRVCSVCAQACEMHLLLPMGDGRRRPVG